MSRIGSIAALHAAVFVAAIAWLARAVTRVEAVRGATPVPAATLVKRLQSLAATGVPFTVGAGSQPGAERGEAVPVP